MSTSRRNGLGGIIAALLILFALIGHFSSDGRGNAPTQSAALSAQTALPTATPTPTPTPTKVPQVVGDQLIYRITSATKGRTFGAPLDLRPLPDGRHYLIVAMEISNPAGDSVRLDSDHFRLRIQDQSIKEAGDLVDGIAAALGLTSMGDMLGTYLDGGDRQVFALVYKAPATATAIQLLIDRDGLNTTIDLAPWLGEQTPAQAIAPSPTPTNTPTPAPTDTPTPIPTDTPVPTSTPPPTSTPEPTSTPTPSPTASPTPLPTETPTPSPTPLFADLAQASSQVDPAAVAASIPTPAPTLPSGVPASAGPATVLQVIDGRTVRVEQDGVRRTLSLIGVDVPVPGERTVVECYGDESQAFLRRFLPTGSPVWIELDAVQHDANGRTLVYLWVADEATGTSFLLNTVVLQQGYGVLDAASPNTARFGELQGAEARARAEQHGLWGPCGSAHVLLFPPTPTPAPPTPTPLPPTPTPVPLVTDCGVFGSYAEANTYYQANPAAQPFLDPNWDGRACEIHFGVDQPAQGIVSSGGGSSGGGSCAGGYINVDGNCVQSPGSNPAGATARCRDGTYSYSQHRQGTCSHHGGVDVWL